ncbi:MAG: zinc-dependent metalloprotease [Acidobacteria bacterium]|nr:zinc-dependent metalloprotease [Acidobacteriota bacterium]
MTGFRIRAVAGAALLALLPVLWLSGCVTSGMTADSAAVESPSPFAEKLAGTERRDGLLTFHLDRKEGKVWLELPAPAALQPPAAPQPPAALQPPAAPQPPHSAQLSRQPEGVIGEYLYVEGLLTGLGSNSIGLDRGQLGPSRLVVLRRLGNRLLVEEQNLDFRALSDDPRERKATRESFANSVLWAGEIEEEAPDGRALVDFTSFLVRDAHGVSRQLEDAGQGTYSLDETRSAVDFSACLGFPDNLEFEALLTFVSDSPGELVSRTAPRGEAFGLVQHHSLIRLPDEGYRPRRFDPRTGSFAIAFQDYAAPLDESIEKRWIVRHRLTRTGPDSELIYYVDSGAPEPVRSALIEGASWWAEAFAAAGFPEGYRVEVLPDDVHPLDVRYNVIQWVHRSTRGWSYGGGVIDPRTGEMIKGHVSLGSLRVRQDRLIFEGLLGTGKTGSGDRDDPIELALARIRQLAAHEVGHTLGFAHNFAASTYGRASVMDYPAPWVRITDTGELDVSQAYAVGVGAWDVHSTRYAYSEFPDAESEARGLENLIRDSLQEGLLFLSDQDARPPGAAQPIASLWDNGADAAAQLVEELEVRRIALGRFGLDNISEGSPVALLEEVLATVYFRHRYQLEAALKMIGGLNYAYALKGDGRSSVESLSAQDQRRALGVVLSALSVEALDLPEAVLELLAPRPFGYETNREMFAHRTSPAFDAIGAAATAAGLVVDGLLQPQRAARLVDLHRRNSDLPGLDEVLNRLIDAGFVEGAGEGSGELGRYREIRHAVQNVIATGLIGLASDAGAAPSVRAAAESSLRRIVRIMRTMRMMRMVPMTGAGDRAPASDAGAHEMLLASTVSRFLDRTASVVIEDGSRGASPAIPPGSPIGTTPRLAGSGGAGGFGGAGAGDLGDCSMASGQVAMISGGAI